MIPPELWMVGGGVFAIASGIVHWFYPYTTNPYNAGLKVDVDRLTRFDVVVGRIMSVALLMFGVTLLAFGVPALVHG